jgi:hypothetical protein
VTLDFDANSSTDHDRIAALYRHGRVHSHITTDGRVAIEADVPRRMLDRLSRRE